MTESNEPVHVSQVLEQIKRDVRRRRTSRTEAEARPPGLAAPEQLHRLGSLPEQPTLDDVPALRGLARVPIAGRLVALLRDLYGSLWFLTQKRLPWIQQIRFNAEVAAALDQVEMLAELSLEHDRILVALNRRLYVVEQKLGLVQNNPAASQAEEDLMLVARAAAEMSRGLQQETERRREELGALAGRLADLERQMGPARSG